MSSRPVALVACAATKGPEPGPARALYRSALFEKSLRYAEAVVGARAYVLSARHGLVAPDDVLAPYDLTLNALPVADVRRWAGGVLDSLADVADLDVDRFVVLAGERYRRFLVPRLARFEVPMAGLGIGEQLRWLNARLGEAGP